MLALLIISCTLLPIPVHARQPISIVTIWWPATLYPDEDSTALALLNQHRSRYAEQTGTTINIRIKRTEGVGGIYSTLRTAAIVAPDAMPDLIIIRRSDLIAATQGNLVTPVDMDGLEIEDWFTAALTLGVVGGIQYGIPYTLELQHMLYLLSTFEMQPRDLSAIYAKRQEYLFPANGVRGVNPTFLGQYLAAGGQLTDDNGTHTLDRAPLIQVLTTYETALDEGLIGEEWLTYTSPDTYFSQLTNGSMTAGQIDSTIYLGLNGKQETAYGYAPIPNGSGVVDGWMWALTAQEPAQRERALDVLRFLLETERLGTFTDNLGVLPSRMAALEAWETDYAIFAETVLQGRVVPPPDQIDPLLGSAMQSAFESVITGKQSAESATDAALAQIIGTP